MGRICLRTTEATSWVPGLAAPQPQVATGPAHGPLLSMGLVAELGVWVEAGSHLQKH